MKIGPAFIRMVTYFALYKGITHFGISLTQSLWNYGSSFPFFSRYNYPFKGVGKRHGKYWSTWHDTLHFHYLHGTDKYALN